MIAAADSKKNKHHTSDFSFMNRREAKMLTKQNAIIESYFKQHKTPKAISSQLRVPVQMVYRTVEYAKKEI